LTLALALALACGLAGHPLPSPQLPALLLLLPWFLCGSLCPSRARRVTVLIRVLVMRHLRRQPAPLGGVALGPCHVRAKANAGSKQQHT
jgi:hypothetical protein